MRLKGLEWDGSIGYEILRGLFIVSKIVNTNFLAYSRLYRNPDPSHNSQSYRQR